MLNQQETGSQKRTHFRVPHIDFGGLLGNGALQSASMEVRVARAAAITGQGLSDFAVSTLSEKSDQIVTRHNIILLTSDEYKFFLNALAEDRNPSTRSRAAAKRYQRGRRKGVRYHVGS